MISHASEWRIALARALATEYAVLANVQSVFVSGSAARGQADRFSDLELCVIWHAAPTEPERQTALTALGADIHRLYPYDPAEELWEDLAFIGRDAAGQPQSGVQVEISHFLGTTIADRIERVLVQHDISDANQVLMAGIHDALPLHQPALIEEWQRRIADYPDALQVAMISRYGVIDHFWRWQMFVARGNNAMELAAHWTAILHHVIHLIVALNRIYFSGYKWLDDLLARAPIAPVNLADRLRSVYALPPAEAALVVQAIVEETFDLIAQHVPAANVARFRQIFAFARPQWGDDPPPQHMPASV